MEHGHRMVVNKPTKPIRKSEQQAKSEHKTQASNLLQSLTEMDTLLVNSKFMKYVELWHLLHNYPGKVCKMWW